MNSSPPKPHWPRNALEIIEQLTSLIYYYSLLSIAFFSAYERKSRNRKNCSLTISHKFKCFNCPWQDGHAKMVLPTRIYFAFWKKVKKWIPRIHDKAASAVQDGLKFG